MLFVQLCLYVHYKRKLYEKTTSNSNAKKERSRTTFTWYSTIQMKFKAFVHKLKEKKKIRENSSPSWRCAKCAILSLLSCCICFRLIHLRSLKTRYFSCEKEIPKFVNNNNNNAGQMKQVLFKQKNNSVSGYFGEWKCCHLSRV